MKILTKQGITVKSETFTQLVEASASSRQMQASRLRTKPAVGFGSQVFEKSKTVRDMSRRHYLFVVKRKKMFIAPSGATLI